MTGPDNDGDNTAVALNHMGELSRLLRDVPWITLQKMHLDDLEKLISYLLNSPLISSNTISARSIADEINPENRGKQSLIINALLSLNLDPSCLILALRALIDVEPIIDHLTTHDVQESLIEILIPAEIASQIANALIDPKQH